ncbi:MAG TPA: TolC family protein, partial [Planctomycetota bacterium]|nr:TolC family protein [Planctomycetota bacterium]
RPDGTAPVAPSATAGATRAPLSLEQCLRLAAARSRRLELAATRVEIAREEATGSVAELLPRVDASGRMRLRDNNPGFAFPGGDTGFGSTFVAGDKEVPSARVAAVVPIWDFGGAWNRIQAARGRADVAELAASRERQDLALDASDAYFRVLEAQRLRQVVGESIAAVERQLAQARDALAQGIAAANEVLTVEVQLAERREELIRADNEVEVAKASLNRVIGRDVTAPLELEDVSEAAPWAGGFEEALAAAIDRRPDLAELRRAIEVARAEWRAARAGFAPKIYAFGEYDFQGDEYLLHQQWFEGGVGIDIPIFEGGRTRTQLAAAEAAIVASIARHDERVDDIVLEVKEAHLAVREALARIPVARQAVAQGEENLRVVRDQYGHGLLTSAEVLLEEDRLSRARASYFRALYDEHRAFARLAHAMGGAPPR